MALYESLVAQKIKEVSDQDLRIMVREFLTQREKWHMGAKDTDHLFQALVFRAAINTSKQGTALINEIRENVFREAARRFLMFSE